MYPASRNDLRWRQLCRRNSAGRAGLSLVTLMIQTGCTVGPDYEAVRPQLPPTWNAAPAQSTSDGPDQVDLSEWWRTLNDPALNKLIVLAVAGNQDLRLAHARVREARARRGISTAALWPTIERRASATQLRTSENSFAMPTFPGPGGIAPAVDTTQDFYTLELDASWEIDVFGRTRRSIEAADADIETRSAELRDVLVTLLAEVALNYLELRTSQQRLEVARSNLASQELTCELAQWREAAGLATRLDVEQARSILAQSRSTVPGLEATIDQTMNRLATLIGGWPGSLDAELDSPARLATPDIELALGVPAETIRRRPDVRAAERRLASQTSQIGVAKADLYPRFALLGSIGLESLSTDNLIDARSRTYSIGPSVTWPIFNTAAFRANINVQTVLQEQALIEYQSTVLEALEEVEAALIAYMNERARQDTLRQAVESASRATALSLNEYEAGLIDFQTVLDAQRTQLAVEDQLASSAGEVLANLVRLYKALGGGWESFDERDYASSKENQS